MILLPTPPAGERRRHDGPQPGGAGGHAAQHPAGRERQRGGGPPRRPLPPPRAGESFVLLHRVLQPPPCPSSPFGSAPFFLSPAASCRFPPLPVHAARLCQHRKWPAEGKRASACPATAHLLGTAEWAGSKVNGHTLTLPGERLSFLL